MFIRSNALAFAVVTLLAGCSHGSLGSTTIANGGIVVHGADVVLHGTGGTEASLDATGNLVIGGHPATVTDAQRQQLQLYYRGALAVRQHGIATGKAGAAIGVQALKSAATKVTGGDDVHADASLDAATRQVDEEASKICLDMRQIKASQDRLAIQLPAFEPFSKIVDDAGDCSNRSLVWRDAGRSVTFKSGDGNGVRVVRTEPASVWGLRQGDVILAVDGRPVDVVDDLIERLSADKPADARLHVRRGSAEQDVTVAGRDYVSLVDSRKTSAE